MKAVKPCKICGKPRWGTSCYCRTDYFAEAKRRKEERAARKKQRHEGSQKFSNSQKKKLKAKLDNAFSLFIRSAGKCERCGKKDNLQTSHIYTRANLAVRWDTLNACCLCPKCHWAWHKNPYDGIRWLQSVRTAEQLEELTRRANMVKKWTVSEMEEMLKSLSLNE